MKVIPSGLRSIITTISLLWLSTAAGAGMVFVTQMVLARLLGPAEYGLFASSLSTITMVAPLAGFGLSQFWLRVYGVEGWIADRWLKPSLRFVLITTTLTISLVVLWAYTGAPANGTRFTLLMLLPVILSVLAVDLISSKLRLEEHYNSLALWQMLIPFGRLAVAVTLMFTHIISARYAALGYCFISSGIVLFAVPQFKEMLLGNLKLHGHGTRSLNHSLSQVPAVKQLWSQAWAYGLAAVLYSIFFQISTVLLKYFDGDIQAGMFNVAMAVMAAIYLLPATIYQKYMISKLHRWAIYDKEKFWIVYRKGIIAMFVTGLLVSVLMVLVLPWLVPIAFGEKYLPVVKILMVLALCPPIRYLSTAIGSALLSEKQMRNRVIAMSMAIITTILMNLFLIPHYSIAGAAAALVIGEIVLLVMLSLTVRRSKD